MPSEPIWVEAKAAIQLNAEAVRRTGEPHELRDRGLLESALSGPRNSFAYDDETNLAKLAAILMMAVARNHPFQQGNKRTAFAVGNAFLSVNGYTLSVDTDAFADLFLAVLTHQRDVGELAAAIDAGLSDHA